MSTKIGVSVLLSAAVVWIVSAVAERPGEQQLPATAPDVRAPLEMHSVSPVELSTTAEVGSRRQRLVDPAEPAPGASQEEIARTEDPALTVLGLVLDLAGQPLAGCSLQATPLLACPSDHPELDLVEQLGELPSATRLGRTDARGRYALQLPGEGTFVLEASRTGSGAEALAVEPSPVVPRHFRLGPGAELRGSLRDADGSALAGREVVLLDRTEGSPGYRIQSVETGRSGSFRFADLAPRRYTLLLPLDEEGGALATASVPGEPLVVQDGRNLRLRAMVVREGSGMPIEGAAVAVVGRRSFARGQTGIDGLVELGVADSVLQVSVRVPTAGVLRRQVLVPADGGAITLQVGTDAACVGRVLDPSGRPVGGAAIAIVGAGGVLEESVTGTNGGFAVALPRGTRGIVAARASGLAAELPPAPVDLTERELEVRLRSTWRVRGRVVDGRGGAVSSALVHLRDPGQPSFQDAIEWMGRGQSARSDSSGHFVLEDVVPRPRHAVSVQHPTFASCEAVRAVSPEGVLYVRLRELCTLAGSVLDPGGQPAAMAAVVLEWPEGPALDRDRTERIGRGLRTLTGVDGRFVFDQAPAGEVTLRVLQPPFPEASRRLELAPSLSSSVELRLDAGHQVRVLVLSGEEPRAGAPVRLVGSSGGVQVDRSAVTDESGSHVFDLLLEGRYVVLSGRTRSRIEVGTGRGDLVAPVVLRTDG